MNPNTQALRALAYHEAGHAAVAVVLGFRIAGVEITPGGPEQDGLCRRHTLAEDAAHALALETGDEDAIRKEAMLSLAGLAAEQVAGLAFEGEDLGLHRDFEDTLDLLGGLVCEDHEKYVEELLAETRELLAGGDVWKGVELLAEELLQVGAIDGEKVHAILSLNKKM